jgi:hypothetical protein
MADFCEHYKEKWRLLRCYAVYLFKEPTFYLGLERGPVSLVKIIEELLKKIRRSDLENRDEDQWG